MLFAFVQCGQVNIFVAKRNYFILATLANAKNCQTRVEISGGK